MTTGSYSLNIIKEKTKSFPILNAIETIKTSIQNYYLILMKVETKKV